jgi:hypothetical protein
MSDEKWPSDEELQKALERARGGGNGGDYWAFRQAIQQDRLVMRTDLHDELAAEHDHGYRHGLAEGRQEIALRRDELARDILLRQLDIGSGAADRAEKYAEHSVNLADALLAALKKEQGE